MAKQRTLVFARTSALRVPVLAVSVAVLLAACGQQQVVKQKQAPLPSSLSTVIEPCSCSTNRRTMDKPRPTPPCARVKLGSTWLKT